MVPEQEPKASCRLGSSRPSTEHRHHLSAHLSRNTITTILCSTRDLQLHPQQVQSPSSPASHLRHFLAHQRWASLLCLCLTKSILPINLRVMVLRKRCSFPSFYCVKGYRRAWGVSDDQGLWMVDQLSYSILKRSGLWLSSDLVEDY